VDKQYKPDTPFRDTKVSEEMVRGGTRGSFESLPHLDKLHTEGTHYIFYTKTGGWWKVDKRYKSGTPYKVRPLDGHKEDTPFRGKRQAEGILYKSHIVDIFSVG